MKSRRVILTIEVETDLPLATLRCVESMHFTSRDPAFPRVSIYETLQVQASAIRPDPQPRSYRARMAKFAKDDAERADPKRPGWFSDRIAEVQSKPEPKPKGMVSVSVRPSSMEPVHTGNTMPGPADLIDMTQDGPHPAVAGGKRIRTMKATRIPRGKAKRAKGAK